MLVPEAMSGGVVAVFSCCPPLLPPNHSKGTGNNTFFLFSVLPAVESCYITGANPRMMVVMNIDLAAGQACRDNLVQARQPVCYRGQAVL